MSIWSDLKRGKIKSSKIERILGPFPAMKHSFIYKVSRFPVRHGTLFYVIYDIKKDETYMTDTSKKIIPQKNFLTMFGQYRKATKGLTREDYLKSYHFVLTKKMREKGTVERHFARSFYFGGDIFEIKKQDVDVHTFYKTITINWLLEGSKEDVKMKNELTLERAEDTLTGMRYHLDPLEFYIEEISREEQVTGYLARLKDRMGSSTTSVDRKSKRRKFRRKLEKKAVRGKSTSTESSPGGLGGAY